MPDDATLQRFDDLVNPCLDERHLLLRNNDNLRTTRDLLLPKLIFGQLDVEDLDIDGQESFNGEPKAQADFFCWAFTELYRVTALPVG